LNFLALKVGHLWPGLPIVATLLAAVTVQSFGIDLQNDANIVVETDAFTEAVAFSPAGDCFTTHGNSNHSLQRWSLPEGAHLAGGWGGTRESSHGEQFPTGAMAYSPSGDVLSAVFGVHGEDGYLSVIIMMDAKSGAEIARLAPAKRTPGHATQLKYSSDGTLLAGTYGPVILVWDAINHVELARIQIGKKHFQDLAFSHDNKTLYAVNSDKTVRVFTSHNWEVTSEFDCEIGKLKSVDISGSRVCVGSDRGKVNLWDID